MPKYAWGAALEVAICEKNRECFDYLTSRPDLCELSLMMSIVWCVKCGALDFLPTIIEMGGDPTSIPYQQRRILEQHAHKPSVDWLHTHCNYYIHRRGHHYD